MKPRSISCEQITTVELNFLVRAITPGFFATVAVPCCDSRWVVIDKQNLASPEMDQVQECLITDASHCLNELVSFRLVQLQKVPRTVVSPLALLLHYLASQDWVTFLRCTDDSSSVNRPDYPTTKELSNVTNFAGTLCLADFQLSFYASTTPLSCDSVGNHAKI